MTEEMSWPEVASALEYVYRYVEPTPASKAGKKYKTMSDFIVRGRDTFRDDISQMRRSVRAK